ncbi:cytochrome oxidase subunit III [Roseiconus nitratireducens]|uniref:Cytochrome oxidase subunit III n=1 Tax=Roseiconus nitratireducens TaxID=2605748 RepID=A0A5M6DHC2_9BACT|nr:cytochrome c oxidase subunit 3 [Roseiconus nitratireducens]KAA5546947.1 cytochrome oxidase subunit III [Roseiconus nitratireducens]
MATTDAGHTSDVHVHEGHDSHDHDHPSYLAHHFDTPEQQFDSGKLGMWLFLVTEILFFSGMFCAYAIFRAWRPEVFEGCSQFLNTKLGAINTGVLLFSSFTMAWAVRCAQLEEHKKLASLLATTLCCAMVFLGVKAIEYSHKWHLGLLPAGLFTYDPANPHPEGGPNYLAYICAPFAVATIGVVIWLVVAFIRDAKFQVAVAKPLVFVCLSFFGGVGLGMILESGETPEHHGSDHVAAVHGDAEHGEHSGAEHGDAEHGDAEHGDAEHGDAEHSDTEDSEAEHGEGQQGDATDPEAADVAEVESTDPQPVVLQDPGSMMRDESDDLVVLERLASDATNTGLQDELSARRAQSQLSEGAITYDRTDDSSATIASTDDNVLRPSRAGVFFSIYYCMTGVHAIHILAGVGVLIWLLVRAIRQDFNRNYFGPVDYVGLYWHLVDLIWIYLFPLMYLIR